MEAVVYTSNTGSTEHYAKLLGHELSVSVYSTPLYNFINDIPDNELAVSRH